MENNLPVESKKKYLAIPKSAKYRIKELAKGLGFAGVMGVGFGVASLGGALPLMIGCATAFAGVTVRR